MADLREMCDEIGFSGIQTYIASGNVVFSSDGTQQAVKAALEDRLHKYAGKPIGVVLRTEAELRAVLENNPFPDGDPKRTLAILLNHKPPLDTLRQTRGQSDEEISVSKREIYVHYGSGIGSSKLRIPAAKEGTARNMNTIAKVVQLASKQPAI